MKGVPFSVEGIRKDYVFYQKWYIKGQGFGPRGGASPSKTLLSAPHPPSPGHTVVFANKTRLLIDALIDAKTPFSFFKMKIK